MPDGCWPVSYWNSEVALTSVPSCEMWYRWILTFNANFCQGPGDLHHDDIMTWIHSSYYRPVAGVILRPPVDSPSKGPVFDQAVEEEFGVATDFRRYNTYMTSLYYWAGYKFYWMNVMHFPMNFRVGYLIIEQSHFSGVTWTTWHFQLPMNRLDSSFLRPIEKGW